MFRPQYQATRRLRTVFWTSFSLVKKTPSSSKSTVAQSFLSPISSNITVSQGVLDKFWLFNKTHHFQEKRQLRRVFRRQFQATGELRTVFCTSFSFLTKVANLKRNDSCGECFDDNLNQLDSCTRCFGQALAF